MVTLTEFERANQRAQRMHAENPRATAAKYDRGRGRIVITLSNGLEVSFASHDAEGLEDATASELDEIKISPSGFGITFPKLDADFYIPALLEGFLGSRKWIAARLGSAGGRSRSLAKLAAARLNGKLGGRPKREKVNTSGQLISAASPSSSEKARVKKRIMSAAARKRVAAAQKARCARSQKAVKRA